MSDVRPSLNPRCSRSGAIPVRQTGSSGVMPVLEIMALATGVLVSFGAATVGSWAILEAVLRLAEPAARIKARRRERRERLRLLAATTVQDANRAKND